MVVSAEKGFFGGKTFKKIKELLESIDRLTKALDSIAEDALRVKTV